MRCVDLNVDTLKILGTHFSYNEKLKEEKKFYKAVTDMQRVLKIWKMRRLTLEGKIVILKTIALSKIVFRAFITTVPKYILNELKKIQNAFFWTAIYMLPPLITNNTYMRSFQYKILMSYFSTKNFILLE